MMENSRTLYQTKIFVGVARISAKSDVGVKNFPYTLLSLDILKTIGELLERRNFKNLFNKGEILNYVLFLEFTEKHYNRLS